MTANIPDATYSVAADELRQFIEQYEHLAQEKAEIAESQKEIMAEAKGRGYNTRVIKRIIAIRKRDKDAVAEDDAVMEIYRAALGM